MINKEVVTKGRVIFITVCLLLGYIILIPLLTYVLISHNSFLTISSDQDWLGFWGYNWNTIGVIIISSLTIYYNIKIYKNNKTILNLTNNKDFYTNIRKFFSNTRNVQYEFLRFQSKYVLSSYLADYKLTSLQDTTITYINQLIDESTTFEKGYLKIEQTWSQIRNGYKINTLDYGAFLNGTNLFKLYKYNTELITERVDTPKKIEYDITSPTTYEKYFNSEFTNDDINDIIQTFNSMRTSYSNYCEIREKLLQDIDNKFKILSS